MSHAIVPNYPINDLIARRWRPFAFSDRAVSQQDLLSLLEAARWSASAANEQPWSCFVAMRDDSVEFQRLLSCVEEVNLSWAKNASILMLSCARLTLEHSGKPYMTAEHDLGLASANLVFEATPRGLAVHQMIHIDRNRARQLYQIPGDLKPVAGLAIGYAGDDTRVSLPLQKEDLNRRPRKSLDSFIFSGSWSEVFPLVKV